MSEKRKNSQKKDGLMDEPKILEPSYIMNELRNIKLKHSKTFTNIRIERRHNWYRAKFSLTIEHYNTEVLNCLEWLATVCLLNGDYQMALEYCHMGMVYVDSNSDKLQQLRAQARLLRDKVAGKKIRRR